MEKGRLTRIAVLVGATLLWAVVPIACGLELATSWGLPVVALLFCAVIVTLDGETVKPLLRPDARALVLGLAAGVVMTALTYPAYSIVARFYPALATEVVSEHAMVARLSVWAYLPRLAVVVVAEELFWRGSWLRLPRAGWLVAWAAYVLAQVALGSWVVPLLGAMCGGAWLGLRWVTRGLWAPLVCHLIWTSTVLLFVPITAATPAVGP